MQGSSKYDQEIKLVAIWAELKDGFTKVDGISDSGQQQALLRELTDRMQEAKALIKEFEREARTDGVPSAELASRKKALVQELNCYIAMKKERSGDLEARKELALTTGNSSPEKAYAGLSTQQLMEKGRKEMKAQDDSLIRAQRIVESTIEVGTRTAETLQGQGEQLGRVLDTLDEIHFSMKKAGQVIRDITRGVATDRCIQALLMVVIVAIVVIIACKSAGVGGKGTALPMPSLGVSPPPPPMSRRLLRQPSGSAYV